MTYLQRIHRIKRWLGAALGFGLPCCEYTHHFSRRGCRCTLDDLCIECGKRWDSRLKRTLVANDMFAAELAWVAAYAEEQAVAKFNRLDGFTP